MPTISQLPSAGAVSATDLVPISQGGSVHAASVGALLAQAQPAIIISPPSLLGRFSLGSGGPDTIAIGTGLTLNSGTLSSEGFNPSSLAVQETLSATDQIVVTNAGTPQLVGVDQMRGIFSAGANITIDVNGSISASNGAISELSTVTSLAAGDLVGVSQGGQDHTVTYETLIDGLTIDDAQPAEPATDSDTFWVGQNSNVMLRQTVSGLWPWISQKLPSWARPVVELTANTALDETLHNNRILVCSAAIIISGVPAELGSGFACALINASSGTVTFASGILTSSGSASLAPNRCGSIQCVTYSGGTAIFASVGA